MHPRKLVKSGQSSYTLALPKKWVARNSLQRGDVLYIDEKEDNTLVITRDKVNGLSKKKEIVLSIDELPDNIVVRKIIAAYLDNCALLIIKGKSLRDRSKRLKNIIRGFLAFEVVEESAERLVAKSFLSHEDADVKRLLRRQDNITRSMFMDMLSLAQGGDPVSEDLMKRDKEVNKLNYLVCRILKTVATDRSVAAELGLRSLDVIRYWDVNLHLEKIADEVKRIARLLENGPTEGVDRELLGSVLQEVYDHYLTIITAFHQRDADTSDVASSRRRDMVKRFDETFENKNYFVAEVTGKCKGILSHLHDISRLTRYM